MGQGTPPGDGGTGGAGGAAIRARSGSTVMITGGTFNFGLGGAGGAGGPGGSGSFGNGATGSPGANGYTLLDNGGAITLFGTFTGGPRTLTTGTGTFTGTLTNATAAQTFSYDITAGSITLAVPEPGTWAALALGAALLGGVTLRRRTLAGA